MPQDVPGAPVCSPPTPRSLGAVARACQKDVIRVIIVKKEDQDDSKGDGEDDAAAADDGTRTKDIFDHVKYDA